MSATGPIHEKKPVGTEEQLERAGSTSSHSDQVTHVSPVDNPLARYTTEELVALADQFTKEHNLTHISDDIRKGALLAQNPEGI